MLICSACFSRFVSPLMPLRYVALLCRNQAAVIAEGWAFCRIDGSMASTEARQTQVELFQAPGAEIPVFLLTTQVIYTVHASHQVRHT